MDVAVLFARAGSVYNTLPGVDVYDLKCIAYPYPDVLKDALTLRAQFVLDVAAYVPAPRPRVLEEEPE